MSVGHVARVIEAAGIPTIIVAVQAFEQKLEAMRPPRLLLTQNLIGRPFGVPHDSDGQRDVLLAALRLLETAVSGGTVQKYERL